MLQENSSGTSLLCTVLLNDRPVATFEAPRSWAIFAGRNRPCNQAFMDMGKAQIWGRIVFEGVSEWVTHMREAEGSEPLIYEEVPGSLLSRFEREVPDFFPIELVEREFFVHADYYFNKVNS